LPAMRGLSVLLGVIGLVFVIVGAVRAHKGRMREVDPGLYSPPRDDAVDLWIAIVGATIAAAGGIVGSFA
jgi:Mn2+/Fe2+ NRAMP family transporter